MATDVEHSNMPPAVVVGLCSHGLATCRALADGGVTVHALESNADLPGNLTRYAQVHRVPAISGPGVVESLLQIRPRLDSPQRPVIFLMNDKMIREVARRWPELESHYQLSWAPCRREVIRLTDKATLEQRCHEVGLNYPKTWTVRGTGDLSQLPTAPGTQFIVKPALPLGSFKARRCDTLASVGALIDAFSESLPFLVQEWIPGDDRRIQFSAIYFDNGVPLARFDGRKLESLPAALGQAIVVESFPDDEVHECTLRFFADLNLSGPVSLELKRAPDGRLWVIEPTIGRTDTHFQAWLANGINAALIEYRRVLGLGGQAAIQTSEKIWFDTERDPLCFFRHLHSEGLLQSWKRADFPYLGTGDFRPAARATYVMFRDYIRRRLR